MAQSDPVSPLVTSGALADRIAKQLANVGKSSAVAVSLVPAGGTRTVSTMGSFCYVIDAPAPFKLRMDGQPYIDVRAGSSLRAVGSAFFESIELFNESASPMLVRLYVGFAEYAENREFSMEPLTEAIGRPEFADPIANNDTILVEPLTLPNIIRRKAVIVSNPHATGDLLVYGRNDLVLAHVFARSVAYIPTADAVAVSNASGGAIAAAVGEIYWVLYPTPIAASSGGD